MEIIDIYEKCPGKERIEELKKDVDSLYRKLTHERKDIDEEIKMVEKTIEKFSDKLETFERNFNASLIKFLLGAAGIFGGGLVSTILFIYFSNL
jgi:predicted  nucleic acid-binding Zn-ribbon protein